MGWRSLLKSSGSNPGLFNVGLTMAFFNEGGIADVFIIEVIRGAIEGRHALIKFRLFQCCSDGIFNEEGTALN